jgi:hypothetical protein
LRNREQVEDRQSGMVLSVAEVAETHGSSLQQATPAQIMMRRHGEHFQKAASNRDTTVPAVGRHYSVPAYRPCMHTPLH